jgi:uncharacterized OB-fold protein
MPEEKESKPYAKPVPYLEAENRPYFEALQRGELYYQRCHDCGFTQFHPRGVCSRCLSPHLQWVKSAGRGTVYSFSVTYQNSAPGFREALPYIMAYVEIEEGLKILTNLVDCQPQEAKIGMPVEAVFSAVKPDFTLLTFRPRR